MVVNNIPEEIKQLAEKAEVDETELLKMREVIKQELMERGIPEDRVEEAVIARLSASLKKQFVTVGAKGTKVRGIVMGRHKAKDWAAWNREDTIKKMGSMSQEAAIQAGFMNAKGEMLYTTGKFNIGKPIPENDYTAEGYGIVTFEKDGKEDTRFAIFKMKGDAAVGDYPFFTECDMFVTLLNGKDPNVYELGLYNAPGNFEDSYVDFHDYADYVIKACGDEKVQELAGIDAFAVEKAASDEKYNNWAIAEGNVIKFGVSQTGKVGVSIDDASLNIDTGGAQAYTIWFPENTEFDFSDNAIGVTFLVSTMVSDKGETVLFGLGYWVDSWFRVDKSITEDANVDVQNPW